MTWNGGVFDDNLPAKKALGQLHIENETIHFSSEMGLNYQLPVQELLITKGGVGNRFWFLEHPSYSFSLFSEDPEFGKALKNLNHPALTQLKNNQKAELNANFKWLTVALFVIAIFGASAYFLKDPVVGLVAKAVPVSFEESLSEMQMKQMQITQSFVSDSVAIKELIQMSTPLIQALPEKKYKYRFYISHSDDINAFAMPGGYVVVNEGLIRAARNGEEILGVLGHEIGHVERQHGLRNIISSLGIFAILQLALGDASGIIAVVAQSGATLMTQSFSRDYERDADRFGMELLHKAKVDPNGLISFFEVLLRKEKDNKMIEAMNNNLNFLSTHPATQERIENLKKQFKTYSKIESNPAVNQNLKQLRILLKMPGA